MGWLRYAYVWGNELSLFIWSTVLLLPAGITNNVGSTRLDVHVKKGLQDGLYISR